MKSYNRCKYLENLSEESLFDFYQEALSRDNKYRFEDFDQEQRDIYLRLKLRSLNHRLSNRDDEEEKRIDPQSVEQSETSIIVRGLQARVEEVSRLNQDYEV